LANLAGWQNISRYFIVNMASPFYFLTVAVRPPPTYNLIYGEIGPYSSEQLQRALDPYSNENKAIVDDIYYKYGVNNYHIKWQSIKAQPMGWDKAYFLDEIFNNRKYFKDKPKVYRDLRGPTNSRIRQESVYPVDENVDDRYGTFKHIFPDYTEERGYSATRSIYRGGRKSKTARKTRKATNKSNSIKSRIIQKFLGLLVLVKLYHWKTKSYAQHKATDEFYGKLNENIDKFVEVLLGKTETRIRMVEKKLDMIDSASTEEFKDRIYEYREFLTTDLNRIFKGKGNSDILSVRDDILVDLNQFLYLMTFDK